MLRQLLHRLGLHTWKTRKTWAKRGWLSYIAELQDCTLCPKKVLYQKFHNDDDDSCFGIGTSWNKRTDLTTTEYENYLKKSQIWHDEGRTIDEETELT